AQPKAAGAAKKRRRGKGKAKAQSPKEQEERKVVADTIGRSILTAKMKKTKMCEFHKEGRCKYGADCAFAHTESELQQAPDLRKTRLCRAFLQGKCNDSDCKFAHGEEELRAWHPSGKPRKIFVPAIQHWCTNCAGCARQAVFHPHDHATMVLQSLSAVSDCRMAGG
ncbi:ZFP36, partial [Symbiodinium necroappetens]